MPYLHALSNTVITSLHNYDQFAAISFCVKELHALQQILDSVLNLIYCLTSIPGSNWVLI